jgi:uncharacterized membrane protein
VGEGIWPSLFVALGTQVLFTTSDFLARAKLREQRFRWLAFVRPWFALYSLIRVVALAGGLFILANVYMGEAAAILGATSLVISNILGLLLLKEVVTLQGYVGIFLALSALVVVAIR